MPWPNRKSAATRTATEASRQKRLREKEEKNASMANYHTHDSEWDHAMALRQSRYFEDPEEIDEDLSSGAEDDGSVELGSLGPESANSGRGLRESEEAEEEGMVLAPDIFEEMMKNNEIWEKVDNFQRFRYQRGAVLSHQTRWRAKKKELELTQAATNSHKLDTWLRVGTTMSVTRYLVLGGTRG